MYFDDSSDSDYDSFEDFEDHVLPKINLFQEAINHVLSTDITFNGKVYEFHIINMKKSTLFIKDSRYVNIDIWANQRPCDKSRVLKLLNSLGPP